MDGDRGGRGDRRGSHLGLLLEFQKMSEHEIEVLARSIVKRLKSVGCDVPEAWQLQLWAKQRAEAEVRERRRQLAKEMSVEK